MTVDELKRWLQSKAGHWPVVLGVTCDGETSYLALEEGALSMMQESEDGKTLCKPEDAPPGVTMHMVVAIGVTVETVAD